jgi:hypothetical protein
MSNEEDKINFKITKIRVPEQVKMLSEGQTTRLVEATEIKTTHDDV